MLQGKNFGLFIISILLLRLISMAWIPLTDTTEARYAEIARLMVVSNDWVTPWFEQGVAFWGKPPLSFWVQALSFKLLGINEFAARLPSLLATIATLWIIWLFATGLSSRKVAQNTIIIYSTSALVFVLSGAVLTDPFLTLGTTWSMAALYMALKQPLWYWRYGFFLGLSIGLLAKGPLALILTFGPIVLWLILNSSARRHLKALPWLWGTILTLIISLPWYILAELKTPGFINYFIVGEHFMRFLVSDWAGDLYGKAHEKPIGMIWFQWLLATLPWGLFAIILLFWNLQGKEKIKKITTAKNNPLISYLFLWAIVTPAFFTLSGNILWTYLLPAIPAFALLLALAIEQFEKGSNALTTYTKIALYLVPIVFLGCLVLIVFKPNILNTEKHLLAYITNDVKSAQHPKSNTNIIYYLGKLPFSARFYSQDTAKRITMDELSSIQIRDNNMYLAIPKKKWTQVTTLLEIPMQKYFENRRYILTNIPAIE